MSLLLLALVLAVSLASFVTVLILLPRVVRRSQSLVGEVRGELRNGREEARTSGRELREEVFAGIRAMDEALRRTLADSTVQQQGHFEATVRQLTQIGDAHSAAADGIRDTLDSRIKGLQQGNETKLDAIRAEVTGGLTTTLETLTATLDRMSTVQQSGLADLIQQVRKLTESNETILDRIRNTLDSRIKEVQEGSERSREAQAKGLQEAAQRQSTQLEIMTAQLREMSEANHLALDGIRNAFDSRVKGLQESNERKLDEMRKIVEEKLQDTLEKRLGESFKLVSERLEAVHQGLGEMQTLASGVGDLKRVLTNVKARGTWAEYQLAAILEQTLTPEQWSKNVCVREGSLERVEFAIRLPGPKQEPACCTWLPIDSKFLKEDYLRLQAAAEAGDQGAVQAASDGLGRALRASAREIHDKYVCPPHTTDFAIMFLATEGLFAEALRQPDLVDELLQKYRIVIAGPTTLAAILSSLRMGFQTLVVEQRAAEVWHVLGAVKTEFGKFGAVFDKVQRQLQTASRTLDETGVRTRAMERRLRSVEQLGSSESAQILALPTSLASGIDADADGDLEETSRLSTDQKPATPRTAGSSF